MSRMSGIGYVSWRGPKKEAPQETSRDKISRAIAVKKGQMTTRTKKIKISLAPVNRGDDEGRRS